MAKKQFLVGNKNRNQWPVIVQINYFCNVDFQIQLHFLQFWDFGKWLFDIPVCSIDTWITWLQFQMFPINTFINYKWWKHVLRADINKWMDIITKQTTVAEDQYKIQKYVLTVKKVVKNRMIYFKRNLPTTILMNALFFSKKFVWRCPSSSVFFFW